MYGHEKLTREGLRKYRLDRMMWSSNNLASIPDHEGGGLINLLKPGNEAKNKENISYKSSALTRKLL